MWLYKIIIVNSNFADNIEEYIGQGWKITAVNFIPSGSSTRYGPYFRIALPLDDPPD